MNNLFAWKGGRTKKYPENTVPDDILDPATVNIHLSRFVLKKQMVSSIHQRQYTN